MMKVRNRILIMTIFILSCFCFEITLAACPSGFINTDFGFCIMKYEAKNIDGVPVSIPEGNPWNLSQVNAKIKCGGIGGHLVTNSEWMKVARNIESVASNWSNGVVGNGTLSRGYSASASMGDAFTNTVHAPNSGPGYEYNTGADTVGSSGTFLYRRYHTLSNGQVIWDMSGNAWEWVDETVTNAQMPSPKGGGWYNFSVITDWGSKLTRDDVAPTNASYDSTYAVGKILTDADDASPSGDVHGFIRGGVFASGTSTGVFALALHVSPDHLGYQVGFRCAVDIRTNGVCGTANGMDVAILNSSSSNLCSIGEVADFGGTGPWTWNCKGYHGGKTATCSAGLANWIDTGLGFHIMKYEAKIQGYSNGNQTYSASFVPESRPAGTPWVNISQTQAIAECQSLGAGYRLITNAEWTSLARHLTGQATNWSNGAVGNGVLSRGYSANSTRGDSFTNTQAASTTGASSDVYNVSANSVGSSGLFSLKRVHYLANNTDIWDFAGNVWEWNNNTCVQGTGTGKWHSNTVYIEWNDTNLQDYERGVAGPDPVYTSTYNAGQYYGCSVDGNGFLKGGYWGTGNQSGLYSLSQYRSPSSFGSDIGFRCTKDLQPRNGACGSAGGTVVVSLNSESPNLCDYGNVVEFGGFGPWSWGCAGTNGGVVTYCSAYKEIDGVCGEVDSGKYQTLSSESANLCSKGIVKNFTGSGPWAWICQGIEGGDDDECSATKIEEGVCGSAAGQDYLTAPTESLCSSGNPSLIVVQGQWKWSCRGGRTVAKSCSELKRRGDNVSGVKQIDPDGLGGAAPINVYCDMVTDGGGWTMIVAQYEADPVINWNEGVQGDYDPSLLTAKGFVLNNLQIPAHSEVAIGKFDGALTIMDYFDYSYGTDDISLKVVYGKKRGKNYQVHRNKTSLYGSHNPEGAYYTIDTQPQWVNTLTFDEIGGVKYSWAFSPNASTNNAKGFSYNGTYLISSSQLFAWVVLVRDIPGGDVARSCSELKERGDNVSGVKQIDPDGLGGAAPISAYCDMVTDGGGWTMIAAQYEADPVIDWNEGIQEDYDPSLLTAKSFTLNSMQIPVHNQVAFGKDLNPTEVDYANFIYNTGNIPVSLVTSLKTEKTYHVHRNLTGLYGAHDPEGTYFTIDTQPQWINTLTFDETGGAKRSWAFSPNATEGNSRGFAMNGDMQPTNESYAWTVWVREDISGGENCTANIPSSYCGTKSGVRLDSAPSTDMCVLDINPYKNDWALSGFLKRKMVSLTNNSGGNLADYPVRINLAYDSSMQTDFDDIRFVDKEKNVLNYWIESKIDSDSAKVWVKVPEIPVGGKDIYVYFANEEVASFSDSKGVFLLFDDFNSQTLDKEKWIKQDTGTNVVQAGGKLRLLGGSSVWGQNSIYSNNVFNRIDGLAVQGKFSTTCEFGTNYNETTLLWIKDSGTGSVFADYIYAYYPRKVPAGPLEGRYVEDGTLMAATPPTINCGTEYLMRQIVNTDTGALTQISSDGGDTWQLAYNSVYSSEGTFRVGASHFEGGIFSMDDIMVYPHRLNGVEYAFGSNENYNDYDFSQYGPWSWACGYPTGMSSMCSANLELPQCGSVNGQFLPSKPLTGFCNSVGSPVRIDWWNYAFTKRKKISVTSSSALDDHQVKLNISYDSDMQTDFDDLRFVAGDDNTVLSYWVEKKTNGVSAVVWVRVKSLAMGDTGIYMYYGNDVVPSASDGDATFQFFDSFDGDEIDEGKWTISGTIGVSNGFASDDVKGSYLKSKQTINSPIIIDSYLKVNNPGMLGYAYTAGHFPGIMSAGVYVAGLRWYAESDSYDRYVDAVTTLGWKPGENRGLVVGEIRNSWTILPSSQIHNASGVRNISNDIFEGATGNGTMVLFAKGTSEYYTADVDIDWVLARKYAAVEPVSVFGAEEGYGLVLSSSGPWNWKCINGLKEVSDRCEAVQSGVMTMSNPRSSLMLDSNASYWYCSECYDINNNVISGRNAYLDFAFTYRDMGERSLKSYKIGITTTGDILNDEEAVKTDWIFVPSGEYQSGEEIIVDNRIAIKPSPTKIFNQIGYGKSYYWYIQLTNDIDETTDWLYGGNFSTVMRKWPKVRFQVKTTPVVPDQPITICSTTDLTNTSDICYSTCWQGAGVPSSFDLETYNWKCSVCYDNSNNPVPCSAENGNSFYWTMPDSQIEFLNGATSSSPNIISSFSSVKSQYLKLKITGSDGCAFAKQLLPNVLPNPLWIER